MEPGSGLNFIRGAITRLEILPKAGQVLLSGFFWCRALTLLTPSHHPSRAAAAGRSTHGKNSSGSSESFPESNSPPRPSPNRPRQPTRKTPPAPARQKDGVVVNIVGSTPTTFTTLGGSWDSYDDKAKQENVAIQHLVCCFQQPH